MRGTLRCRAASPALSLCALLLAFVACARPDEAEGTPPSLVAFRQRADAYAEVQRRAAATLPPLQENASPAEITARERALAEAVRALRSGAQRGDVFGSAEPLLVAVVRDDWKRRSAKARSGLLAEMPPLGPPPVNAPYPSTIPLATFPPALLEQLPTLPKPLEYRLYGVHLILRDVDANIVVDVIEGALPGSGTAKSAR